MPLRISIAVAAAIALALAVPAAALAQCPQTSLGEIEEEVMCPVCGTPLALATEAPQAQRQREFIQQRIARCDSEEGIKAALIAQYGEDVLATPAGDGFDLSAYVVPGLSLLGAGGAIAFAAVRWRRGRATGSLPAAGGDGGAAPSRADSTRLERDLDRYDL